MTPLIEQKLLQLQQTAPEPFCAYLYDLNALAAHARQMREALPANCELFYAAKANPMAPILATLAPIVDGFEAASGGELTWLAERHPRQRLLFGGPGKLESELEAALRLGVECIHVESLTELERLASLCARLGCTASIMLRMNIPLDGLPSTRLAMGGKPTPFGLDPLDLPEALARVAEQPRLALLGFHFHLMSHQLDRQAHIELMRHYFRTVKGWQRQYGLKVKVLNVGGGIGVDYQHPDRLFDWPEFCRDLEALIAAEQMTGTRLRFECGRFISAGCGYYVMEVLDIKRNLGEWFAIARGGTHHFRTPAAQSHDHPFYVLRGRQPSRLQDASVTLVGQLCTPKDVLARNQPIRELAIGDWLVFRHAGAYAWNISHQHFLMHPAPEQIFLGDQPQG
ncbi:type III PLP-dependent enzyme [Oceanisphaera arctica]|uniref:Diaminopimelate decarboxylase n=1 Tax=Oceanisphaera arctica TaxID=641510 RepID=A0A2P5TM10_9GAMM|nr:type III PLP-dependent enzyme [Oceanisphaera arctica]PPL16437.1 diaminopimelate decarboxylase [Oceanisphaera arctica]GHA03606.1 diaminopimelate decarboxylase [Oceanisphaera arctica]